MYNVIKKIQKDGTIEIRKTCMTLEEAEQCMLEEAQKSAETGTSLVRKGNTVEEYDNANNQSWFSWLYSNQKCLIAEYTVVDSNNNSTVSHDEYLMIDAENKPLNLIVTVNGDNVTAGIMDDNTGMKYYPVDELSDKINLEKIVAYLSQKTVQPEQQQQLDAASVSVPEPEPEPEPENKEITLVKNLVKLLSDERAENYAQWKQVAYALHNIDENLLDCYLDFCKRDKFYQEHRSREVWNSRNYKYDIKSLHNWAKKDDPFGYAQLMKQYKE